jgi:hypothetical protein
MLAHYRAAAEADPVDAHVAAGGLPEQTLAYGRNRPLRRAGFVEHVEREQYRYALPDRVAEQFDGHLDEADLAALTRAVEDAFVDEAAVDEPSESDDEGADDLPREIPEAERGDVEVVADDESVRRDDGFVAEDAAIIDGDGENGDESRGDDGSDDGESVAVPDGNGDDGKGDGSGTGNGSGAPPDESDTGGVEIL